MKKEELIKNGRRAGNSDLHSLNLLKEIMTDKLNTTQKIKLLVGAVILLLIIFNYISITVRIGI